MLQSMLCVFWFWLIMIVSWCSYRPNQNLYNDIDLQVDNTQHPLELSCKRYFDGCNICTEHQWIVSCTEKACEKQEEPKCLDG